MSETAANPPVAAPPAKGPATLLLMVNAVLLVGVLAVVVMMFLGQKKAAKAAPGAPAEAAASESKEGGEGKESKEGGEGKEGKEGGPAKKAAMGAGPTVRFADFVIHLRNPEADRYARMSFEIEVGSDKDKETVTAHTAQLRDAFLAYLSDRTVEELRGSTGLTTIKQSLMKQASDLAPDGHIRSVYITDFVIQ